MIAGLVIAAVIIALGFFVGTFVWDHVIASPPNDGLTDKQREDVDAATRSVNRRR